MKSFRTIFWSLVPGWLSAGQGEIVQWLEGLMLDAFAETCTQTAYLMLPSKAPSDALGKIGADRAIPRGFGEPDASYAARLTRWRYPRGHRTRGNALGLLEQIDASFIGAVDVLQTIDARGMRYTFGTDAVERGVTWAWDSEGLLPNWARFWLFMRPTNAQAWPSFTLGAWGPRVGNPDVCVGMRGVHPGQFAAVKRLVKVGRLSWTPAGRRPNTLVVDIDDSGFPAPDGTWQEWANRDTSYRYVSLHPSV